MNNSAVRLLTGGGDCEAVLSSVRFSKFPYQGAGTRIDGLGRRLGSGQRLEYFCRELGISVNRLLDRLLGLRLAGPRGYPGGSSSRFIPKGVHIRFDTVLNAA